MRYVRTLIVLPLSVFLVGTFATTQVFAGGWKQTLAEHEERINTLEGQAADYGTRIGDLETNDAYQGTQLADHETRIGDAENANTSQDGRLDDLEQNQSALQDQVGDYEGRIADLENQFSIASSDLVGTWDCFLCMTRFHSWPAWWFDGGPGPDSLYRYYQHTVTFFDDGDGTYSWSSEPPNIFRYNDDQSGFGEYVVVKNIIFISISDFGNPGSPDYTDEIFLKRLSETQMMFKNGAHSPGRPIIMVCDKQTPS